MPTELNASAFEHGTPKEWTRAGELDALIDEAKSRKFTRYSGSFSFDSPPYLGYVAIGVGAVALLLAIFVYRKVDRLMLWRKSTLFPLFLFS